MVYSASIRLFYLSKCISDCGYAIFPCAYAFVKKYKFYHFSYHANDSETNDHNTMHALCTGTGNNNNTIFGGFCDLANIMCIETNAFNDNDIKFYILVGAQKLCHFVVTWFKYTKYTNAHSKMGISVWYLQSLSLSFCLGNTKTCLCFGLFELCKQ